MTTDDTTATVIKAMAVLLASSAVIAFAVPFTVHMSALLYFLTILLAAQVGALIFTVAIMQLVEKV